jgi:hypothetical protein
MAKKYFPRAETRLDVMAILATPHPESGAHYAIHLYYKMVKNPRFTVTEATFDAFPGDNETANLMVNGNRVQINIRTGKITPILTLASR